MLNRQYTKYSNSLKRLISWKPHTVTNEMYFTDVGDEYAATADTYVINVNDV